MSDPVLNLAKQYAENRRVAGDLYTATWFEDFIAEAEEALGIEAEGRDAQRLGAKHESPAGGSAHE